MNTTEDPKVIVVTGGTGLVGRALFNLVTKSNNDKRYKWYFVGSKDCDLRNEHLTREFFAKIKPWAIVHLAGIVLGSLSSQDEQWNSWLSNSKIHLNVLEACKEFRVSRLLSCSSIVVLKLKDDMICSQPHYGYIQSKKLLQSGMAQLRQQGITDCLLYSPTNIFGLQDLNTSSRLIPSIFRQLLQTQRNEVAEFNFAPNEEKNLLYNDDFARIIQQDLMNTVKLSSLPFPYVITPPEKLEISNIITLMQTEICKYRQNVKPKYILFKKTNVSNVVEILQNEDESKRIWTPFATAFSEICKQYFVEKQLIKCADEIKRTISLGEFVNTPEITNRVVSVLQSGRLSYGNECRQFECDFARLHECRHAVLSNSGTSSLQVALAAMKELYKWQDGDYVLVPAITFVASINTIIQNNLVPILVDVEKEYYGIDPSALSKVIHEHINKSKNKTTTIKGQIRAVMVVHLFGQPCDMTPISNICNEFFLRIIEDSCETMLAKYENKTVGSFGDIACFSTYVAHLLVTGVGGIATTNNTELALLMRSYVNHGRNNIYMTIDDDASDTSHDNSSNFKEVIEKRFEFQRIGYSYRITELEAAIANADLKHLEARIHKRQDNAQYLISEFKKNGLDKYLQLPKIRANCDHVFMMFPLVLKNESVSKQELILHLEKAKIETRNLMPITTQPVYSCLPWNLDHLPTAEYLNKCGFYIGCHCFLEKTDLDYITQRFVEFFLHKNKEMRV